MTTLKEIQQSLKQTQEELIKMDVAFRRNSNMDLYFLGRKALLNTQGILLQQLEVNNGDQ